MTFLFGDPEDMRKISSGRFLGFASSLPGNKLGNDKPEQGWQHLTKYNLALIYSIFLMAIFTYRLKITLYPVKRGWYKEILLTTNFHDFLLSPCYTIGIQLTCHNCQCGDGWNEDGQLVVRHGWGKKYWLFQIAWRKRGNNFTFTIHLRLQLLQGKQKKSFLTIIIFFFFMNQYKLD